MESNKPGYWNYIFSRPFNVYRVKSEGKKTYLTEKRATSKKIIDIVIPIAAFPISALILYLIYNQLDMIADIMVLGLILNFVYCSLRYPFTRFTVVASEEPDYNRMNDRHIGNRGTSIILAALFVWCAIISHSIFFIRYLINDDSKANIAIHVYNQEHPVTTMLIPDSVVNIEANRNNTSEIRVVIKVSNCPEPLTVKYNGRLLYTRDITHYFRNWIWDREYQYQSTVFDLDYPIKDNSFEIIYGKNDINFPFTFESK